MELYKYSINKGERSGIAIASCRIAALRSIQNMYERDFELNFDGSEIDVWRVSNSVTSSMTGYACELHYVEAEE